MTQSPLILFTVGTDHHPFDRLMAWAEAWARANERGASVIVQHGSSRVPIGVSAAHVRLPREQLGELMTRATAIVAHGGGGSITQCWEAGKLPIVVPRLGTLGEHVDEHQEAFASRLAQMGYADVARTYDELDALLCARVAAGTEAATGVKVSYPTSTVEAVGLKIEHLVAGRRQSKAHRRVPFLFGK